MAARVTRSVSEECRGLQLRPRLRSLKLRSFGHCNPKRKRGTKIEGYREVPRLRFGLR
jgi:hypothetical protein